MRGKFGFRTALANGEITSDHIHTEMNSQLLKFVQYASCSSSSLSSASSLSTIPLKYLPTHFDGHQHIHVLPGVRSIIPQIFSTTVPYTRIPKLGPDKHYLSSLSNERQTFYSNIDHDSLVAEQLWQQGSNDNLSSLSTELNNTNTTPKNNSLSSFSISIPSIYNPDIFVGYTTMGQDCQLAHVKELFQTILNDLDDYSVNNTTTISPTIEWMVHPGNKTLPHHNNSNEAGCGQGPDEFSMSDDREIEMNLLLDKQHILRTWFKDQNISLISYEQLRVN